MNRTIAAAALALFATLASAKTEYDPITFKGAVSVGGWDAISNLTYITTTGGNYTNGAYTNTYRVSGTNWLGRIPMSSNITVTATGSSNAANMVRLFWDRYDGIRRYAVDRSYDAGVTWTNWIELGAASTNFDDTGLNTWTNQTFTNVHTTILVSPSVPWTPASNLTALADATNDLTARAIVIEAATNSLDSEVDALQTATNSLDGEVNALQTATNELTARVILVEAATNSLDGEVDAIQTATNTITGQVNGLQTGTNALTVATNNLTAQGNALDVATNLFTSQISGLQSGTNALTSATNNAATRLNLLESATNSLDGEVAALQTATNSLDGEIDALQTATNSLDSEVAALQTATNTLTAGVGTNDLQATLSKGAITKSNITFDRSEFQLLGLRTNSVLTLGSAPGGPIGGSFRAWGSLAANVNSGSVQIVAATGIGKIDFNGGTGIADWNNIRLTELAMPDPTATNDAATVGFVQEGSNALQVQITALATATNSLDSEVATLQAATNSLDSEVDALQTATNALTAQQNLLEAATNSLDGEIASLQVSTNSMDTEIGLLQAATNGLDGEVATLQVATNSLDDEIALLQVETNNLNTATNTITADIITLEAATNSLDSEIASLQTGTNNLSTATNSLTTNVTSLIAATNSLDTEVAALQVATNELTARAITIETATNSLDGEVNALQVATNEAIVRIIANEGFTNRAATAFTWGNHAVAGYIKGETNNFFRISVADPSFLDTELTTNGTFAGNAAGWSLSNASYVANQVFITFGSTGQLTPSNNLNIVSGSLYRVSFDVEVAVGGSGENVTMVMAGETNAWGPGPTTTRVATVFAENTNNIVITGSAALNSIKIDNVSVKKYLKGEIRAAGRINADQGFYENGVKITSGAGGGGNWWTNKPTTAITAPTNTHLGAGNVQFFASINGTNLHWRESSSATSTNVYFQTTWTNLAWNGSGDLTISHNLGVKNVIAQTYRDEAIFIPPITLLSANTLNLHLSAMTNGWGTSTGSVVVVTDGGNVAIDTNAYSAAVVTNGEQDVSIAANAAGVASNVSGVAANASTNTTLAGQTNEYAVLTANNAMSGSNDFTGGLTVDGNLVLTNSVAIDGTISNFTGIAFADHAVKTNWPGTSYASLCIVDGNLQSFTEATGFEIITNMTVRNARGSISMTHSNATIRELGDWSVRFGASIQSSANNNDIEIHTYTNGVLALGPGFDRDIGSVGGKGVAWNEFILFDLPAGTILDWRCDTTNDSTFTWSHWSTILQKLD